MVKDAFIKAVIHDGVNVHTVKHFGRHRPAALQTILDLGPPPDFTGASCRECGRKYNLQWDHIDPVANGGPTCYVNAQALCIPDHVAKTERDRKAGLLKRRPQGP
jgi:5-methylcytosine-specific restriction endonuclease McrA